MAKNGAENGAAPKAKIAKKVGRRTKCTEDYVSRFLERIEAGQSVPAAAAVAGLHISTVMEWLAREWVNPGGQFAEFAAAYARAKSVGENRLVSQIVAHGAKDSDRASHPPHSSMLGLCGSYESPRNRQLCAKLPRKT